MAQQEYPGEGAPLSELLDDDEMENILSEDEEDDENEGDDAGDDSEVVLLLDDDDWDDNEANDNMDAKEEKSDVNAANAGDDNDRGLRNAVFSSNFAFPLGGWEPISVIGNGSFVLAVTQRDPQAVALESKLVSITAVTGVQEFQCEDQNRLGSSEMVKTNDIMLLTSITDRCNYFQHGWIGREVNKNEDCWAVFPNDESKMDFSTTYYRAKIEYVRGDSKRVGVTYNVRDENYDGSVVEIPTMLLCNGVKTPLVARVLPLDHTLAGKTLLSTIESWKSYEREADGV